MGERDFDWAKVREGVHALRRGESVVAVRREAARATTAGVIAPVPIAHSLIEGGGRLTPTVTSAAAGDGTIYVQAKYGGGGAKIMRWQNGKSGAVTLPGEYGRQLVKGPDGKVYALCFEQPESSFETILFLVDLSTNKTMLTIKSANNDVVREVGMRRGYREEPSCAVAKNAKGELALEMVWTTGDRPPERHYVPLNGAAATRTPLPGKSVSYVPKRDGTGFIAVGWVEEKLRAWDLTTGQVHFEKPQRDAGKAWVAEDARGGVVVVTSHYGDYTRYESGNVTPTTAIAKGAGHFTVDAKGEPLFVIEDPDRHSRKWMTLGAPGSAHATNLAVDQNELGSGTFRTSNGTFLVSQAAGGLRFFDLATGAVQEFNPLAQEIQTLETLPDGRVIAVTRGLGGAVGLAQLYGEVKP